MKKRTTKDAEYSDLNAQEREDQERELNDHLTELRWRLIIILIFFLAGTITAFFFSEPIFEFLKEPFYKNSQNLQLNLSRLAEGLVIKLKIAMITSFIGTIPLIFWQTWRFILPAIEKTNRKFYRFAFFLTFVLFASGIIFSYSCLLNFTIQLFLKFTYPDVTQIISASSYLEFLFILCCGMGLLFEFPVLIIILTKIGLITPEILKAKRKYAIVIFWILAAFLTPPEPVTQAMLAIPLMILYEISILFSHLIYQKELRRNQV